MTPEFTHRERKFKLGVEYFEVPQDIPPGRRTVEVEKVVGLTPEELRQWVGSIVVQKFGDEVRAVGAVRWSLN